METKKGEQSVLFVTHPHDGITYSYTGCMKIYLTVTELWAYKNVLKKSNERGITWKLRKEEQSGLDSRHIIMHLIHIPIRLHEDTPNSY